MSKIEWTDKTWNPVTGCTKISTGCKNCYADRMSKRLAGRCGYPAQNPFQPGIIHEDKFKAPFSWKKPCTVFVCSMGDLFHSAVKLETIHKLFSIMNQCNKHRFILLTKRPERMLEFAQEYGLIPNQNGITGSGEIWPDHIWAGTSAENQAMLEQRWSHLKHVPAKIKFISNEPALEKLDISKLTLKPDWIICGSESGTQARPMELDWARQLKNQCIDFNIKFFFKQIIRNGKKVSMPEIDGGCYSQMPQML